MSYNYAQHHAMGRLLAGMTKADHRLLMVEDKCAKDVMRKWLPQTFDKAHKSYEDQKNVYMLDNIDHCYGSLLIYLPLPSKIRFLGSLLNIAECDGEFHDDERSFLLRVSHQMMIPAENDAQLIASISEQSRPNWICKSDWLLDFFAPCSQSWGKDAVVGRARFSQKLAWLP